MARFRYDNLNETQLRLAIELLGQQDEVIEVLETSAEDAISAAIAPFGLDSATEFDGAYQHGRICSRAKHEKKK